MSQRKTTGQELTNELLQALLMATDEQKHAALCSLRGEPTNDAEAERPEPYLTLREVGRRLNVSPCSLWRWGIPGMNWADAGDFVCRRSRNTCRAVLSVTVPTH